MMTFEKRVAKYSKADGDCIVWFGGRDKNGYGLVHDELFKKTRRVHRAVFERAHGPIPSGIFICHACDNPSCINLDHLFAGTPKENTQDMLAKGRRKKSRRDTAHHATKIPHARRDEIRAREAEGVSQTKVAEEFGVSQSLVSQICRRSGSYAYA